MSHEIAHAESIIRSVEDREIELMEAAETLAEPIRQAVDELRRTEKLTAEQLEKLEAGIVGAQERLQALEADRDRLADTIPPDTLDLYQRLSHKKGTLVVVPAEGEVCGGCHVRAPAQTLIQLRGDRQLTQCPNCGRILYRVV